MALLIFYAALALGVSFLCSLLEAALLSLPRSHVETMIAQGSSVGRPLKAMKDNIDRPLAAILTLNTIAHTVGAAGVGAQAAIVFTGGTDAGPVAAGYQAGSGTAVGIASAVMTLAILVFSEIIPKTLGAVHARTLAAPTYWITRSMIVFCYPLILLLERMNRLIGYERGKAHITRMEILSTINLGGEAGSLEEREHRIASNVLELSSVPLSKILTPRTVVFALSGETTVGEAVDRHHPLMFARIPVYEGQLDDVVGYVHRFDIHTAAREGRRDTPLGELAKPVLTLPETASVADSLDRMLTGSEHVVVAVDEYGGVEGIVTLEDVIETLLGHEITDETDTVTDMRHLARSRRRG